jgi:hypothetical protein
MKRLILVALVFGLLGLVASAASAQIVNPTKVNFTASPDHATVTSYEVAYFVGTDTATPLNLTDLGKPAPDTVTGCTAPAPCIEAPAIVTPLPNGIYVARVRAKQVGQAGTQYSVWSDASNTFERSTTVVLRPPNGVLIKK